MTAKATRWLLTWMIGSVAACLLLLADGFAANPELVNRCPPSPQPLTHTSYLADTRDWRVGITCTYKADDGGSVTEEVPGAAEDYTLLGILAALGGGALLLAVVALGALRDRLLPRSP